MKDSGMYNGEPLEIDFSRPGVPHTAEILKPDLIKEGGVFQCIWYSEQTEAITGEGETPEKAIQAWGDKVQAILDSPDRTDELATEIRDAFVSEPPPPDEARSSNDAFDVTEGIPTRSEINPDNEVDKKSREHTPDESNKDGSE